MGHTETTQVPPGSLWRHYKGGLYRVLSLALREEDKAQLVLYTLVPLPGKDPGPVWCRPLMEWLGDTYQNGVSVRRYTQVTD